MSTAPDAADTDEAEEYEARSIANQSPTTRICVYPTELFTPQSINRDDAQNSDSFGLVVEDVEVVIGDAFENTAREDGPIAQVVDEGSTSATDYRIADANDKDASFDREGNFQTDEESRVGGELANTYTEGSIDGETTIYYNGRSGNRIARTLDFNGRPFAKTNDDGYFTGGLYQVHSEWRNYEQRTKLSNEGKAPRVVREPRLRDDVRGEPLLIDVSRLDEGRGYEMHVFWADEFVEEFGSDDASLDELERNQYGGFKTDAELDFPVNDNASQIISDEDIYVAPYDGEGWESITDESLPSGSSTTDFTVSTSVGGDTTEDPQDQYTEITSMMVDTMEDTEAAHGMEPSAVFDGGIEGVLDANRDAFTQFPDDGQVDAIRRDVFAQVPWLDVETLED